MSAEQIDYKAEVLKVYPNANIVVYEEVEDEAEWEYAIDGGGQEDYLTEWMDSKYYLWQRAYLTLKQDGKIL